MDAPRHFVKDGLSINELPIEYFCHRDVVLLEIPKGRAEGITRKDLEPHDDILSKVTFALIRTGFERYRRENPKVYQNEGPYIAPSAGDYLTDNFPNLKGIGMDFLAIGSPSPAVPRGELPPDCHRHILGYFTGRFCTGIEDMHLSFSTDAASLLLAASTGDASAGTDHVGLRLSAEDLSIQLDVRSVLEGKRADSTSCGQAVGVTYANTPGHLIVFLADGSQEPADDTDTIMVRDGWYYYKEQDETSSRGYARDLSSGQTVELSPGWEKDITLGSWPSIASDQQEIIALDRTGSHTGTLTVRNPGAPSIALGQNRVEGAGILGDVLYTSYDPDGSDSTSTDHLVLTSVSTGETIAERDEEMGLSGRAVVTPWGLADYDSFYAATEWLDSVPTPASSNSSPSSPVTPTAPRPTPTTGTGPS